MPDVAAPPLGTLPSPAELLQASFESIRRGPMRDVPVLNPAVAVEAVGFRPWQQHWLGVLVTPWFMNLVLLPREPAAWQSVREGESRHHVFPAAVLEFIGARDDRLGDYLACSLFSPMFEFVDHAAARATAEAALDALFDPRTREPDAAPGRSLSAAAAVPSPAPPISKRDFLFGPTTRGRGAP
ncbi:MAG TPA: [NiFe]-hydrogenase assembly chaperone HybE [Caldimonas sp.]|nr:[NiFe]-hydrogenase assembly chaperone HybE [Caldimonas sp.]